MARIPDRRSTHATAALENLGRLSLRELSMESLLQSLADQAKSVMPGAPEASVTLVIEGEATTVVDTGPLALNLDRAQYARGAGPCLHASRTGVATEIVDTRVEHRWPDYARQAAERGNLSSLSVPLVFAGERELTGALNIYAREVAAFDETSRAVATGFAPYAGIAAASVRAYRGAQEMADHLQTALASRAVIEQAKGILIERHKLTADQAFHLLVTASMTTNTKLRDVADHLVRTGELLSP
ncbi:MULTISPECIES: ANTAR domain-containing protein [unclassified Blastococcus]